jgi:hypothetical protein
MVAETFRLRSFVVRDAARTRLDIACGSQFMKLSSNSHELTRGTYLVQYSLTCWRECCRTFAGKGTGSNVCAEDEKDSARFRGIWPAVLVESSKPLVIVDVSINKPASREAKAS